MEDGNKSIAKLKEMKAEVEGIRYQLDEIDNQGCGGCAAKMGDSLCWQLPPCHCFVSGKSYIWVRR